MTYWLADYRDVVSKRQKCQMWQYSKGLWLASPEVRYELVLQGLHRRYYCDLYAQTCTESNRV